MAGALTIVVLCYTAGLAVHEDTDCASRIPAMPSLTSLKGLNYLELVCSSFLIGYVIPLMFYGLFLGGLKLTTGTVVW